MFRLENWKSGRSRGKGLREWDGRGGQESKSNSMLELWMLISSWQTMGLGFNLGYMNHSKVYSNGSGSWETYEGWGCVSTI